MRTSTPQQHKLYATRSEPAAVRKSPVMQQGIWNHMQRVLSKNLPRHFDHESQALWTCAAQLPRRYQGQHASKHISQQSLEEKEPHSFNGFIGHRRGNILAAHQYLENSPRVGTQPSKMRADSVQVEHGRAEHTLVTSRAFQVRFFMILAPDSDISQLQSLQALEVVPLEWLFGKRFRVQDDSPWYRFDIGGRKTKHLLKCTTSPQSCRRQQIWCCLAPQLLASSQ